MPAQFTLPPDTRSVGSGNPPADMNGVVDTLTAMGAGFNVLNAAFAGGADPTGAADSTAAFTAAQAAFGSSPGQIYVPPGTYLIGTSADIPVFGRGQGITGAGSRLVTFNYVGNGTCIAAYDASFSTSASIGGKFSGYTITGSGAGSAATGMSWGNLGQARCADIVISGFSGATATGLQMKNGAGAWSEDAEWTAIKLSGNTVGVLWDSNSFDYSLYQFVISANANQDGLRLQNNAALQGCRLEVRGNFNTGATNTGAVIAIDRANGSGTSRIAGCQMDINAECDGATGTGHYTILMQGGSASQFNGTGVLMFSDETVAFQGASVTSTQAFGFSGLLVDHVLGKMTPGDASVFYGGTQWNEHNSLATAFGGTIFLRYGDLFALQLLNGANSLAFAGTLAGLGRRLELFIAQPSSGGAGTITWPSNVWFPGGNPALSAANGAVDRVRLTYLPVEATWYGELVTGYLANTAGPAYALTRSGVFGDGSDGAVTFDGSTTILGMVPAASVYTMTRDIFCTSITINTGVTVKAAGYRVFCGGPVTGLGTGTISNNGSSTATGTGGTGSPSATTRGGTNGGAGGTGVSGAGVTSTALTSPGAGAGGNGGAGTSGAGGTAGTITSAGQTAIYRANPGAVTCQLGSAVFPLAGGTGGAGGGSDASSNAGGGGGGGGGMLMILAWSVNIAGTVSATGGNGANGTAGNAGGGGGGGGGVILVYTLTPWTAGTTVVTGGTHGNGSGTGAVGVNGGNGTVLNVVIQ